MFVTRKLNEYLDWHEAMTKNVFLYEGKSNINVLSHSG